VRIAAGGQRSGIRQRRVFLESGRTYDGSVWIKVEAGAPRLSLQALAPDGRVLADLPLRTRGSAWQEVPFSFASTRTDRDAVVEISAAGSGAALVDFVSLMRADVRGQMRARNGHPEPYGVRYFQIDNEPMNNGFTPEGYAAIVNLYGSRLRQIAPDAVIIACGQKRSNDMAWSEKVIDLAGHNFDVLGVHNYEYESDLFESGVQRIRDYLVKLRDYVRASAHPGIRLAVLEWNLSRTYDWRAGLHAAGSLILYESLTPELTMTCPALLMRNTTDDPTWTAFIYHDHVSWFPGGGYVVEKLFREHIAETYLASTSGTFRDISNRGSFFTDISQMKPEGWQPGTVDAIATASADGRRIVVKAVNYSGGANTLLVHLQGSRVPAAATVTVYTVTAGLRDAASLEEPSRIKPVERTREYSRDLTIELEPYTVAVVEIVAK
jgi:alpha-L-arabinofuranosidase